MLRVNVFWRDLRVGFRNKNKVNVLSSAGSNYFLGCGLIKYKYLFVPVLRCKLFQRFGEDQWTYQLAS